MSVIANDASALLLDQVNQALAAKTPLRIQGSGSKAFLGRAVEGQLLDVREHRGIVSYDPTELVVTARAGTPLAELEATLDEAGQMLPCEPPHFGEGATVGGMIAAGLSGPRRPWSGSVRDFVLGSRVITGQGKHLRFGGSVGWNSCRRPASWRSAVACWPRCRVISSAFPGGSSRCWARAARSGAWPKPSTCCAWRCCDSRPCRT